MKKAKPPFVLNLFNLLILLYNTQPRTTSTIHFESLLFLILWLEKTNVLTQKVLIFKDIKDCEPFMQDFLIKKI